MNFQRITIYIAIVLLLLTLSFIGYMIYKTKSSVTWPPMVSECPDYWDVGSNNTCNNVQNLGTCDASSMDFSGPEWQGNSGLKCKYNWAKKCGITWDGITNSSVISKDNTPNSCSF